VGNNGAEQCNVGNWTDIVQVAAGIYHTVGLKADGTVVAAGFEFALPTRWNLTKTSNWPLIGGIIAAVAAAGLVIFFVRRKRATQTKGG